PRVACSNHLILRVPGTASPEDRTAAPCSQSGIAPRPDCRAPPPRTAVRLSRSLHLDSAGSIDIATRKAPPSTRSRGPVADCRERQYPAARDEHAARADALWRFAPACELERALRPGSADRVFRPAPGMRRLSAAHCDLPPTSSTPATDGYRRARRAAMPPQPCRGSCWRRPSQRPTASTPEKFQGADRRLLPVRTICWDRDNTDRRDWRRPAPPEFLSAGHRTSKRRGPENPGTAGAPLEEI